MATKKRISEGMKNDDRCMCSIGCVQLAAGRSWPDHEPSWRWEARDGWDVRTPPVPPKMEHLRDHALVFDLHTEIGRIVASMLMRKSKNLTRDYLSWAIFCCRSGRVSPSMDDHYLREWDRQVRARFGETLAEMETRWSSIEPEYERAMRWLLTERGL